jgi:hypothetical protein
MFGRAFEDTYSSIILESDACFIGVRRLNKNELVFPDLIQDTLYRVEACMEAV